MVNLLIVDSQPIMCIGLKQVVSENFPDWNVYLAKSIEEFDRMEKCPKPDMIVFGINMEEKKVDLNQIPGIQTKFKSSFLIIYGEFLNDRKIHTLFSSGIHGYISKKSDEYEFIQCLQTVMAGNTYKDVSSSDNLTRDSARICSD
ncbi:hypothetical protein [Dyadobacter sp. CY312]|uniref:hypothetical protein n=1 Tax=Dyadobacter sp. CY312 TaxID=2907303 RepID=UPI001F40C2C7|nr:hypothetical protein [Dyadobacter sp. CY312]MCE7042897.1 hypothetical protein [Dyadobacter sp. CY312]